MRHPEREEKFAANDQERFNKLINNGKGWNN